MMVLLAGASVPYNHTAPEIELPPLFIFADHKFGSQWRGDPPLSSTQDLSSTISSNSQLNCLPLHRSSETSRGDNIAVQGSQSAFETVTSSHAADISVRSHEALSKPPLSSGHVFPDLPIYPCKALLYKDLLEGELRMLSDTLDSS
jgi:hypothetical protein